MAYAFRYWKEQKGHNTIDTYTLKGRQVDRKMNILPLNAKTTYQKVEYSIELQNTLDAYSFHFKDKINPFVGIPPFEQRQYKRNIWFHVYIKFKHTQTQTHAYQQVIVCLTVPNVVDDAVHG